MSLEYYIVCALPYSCSAATDFHVSLYFSPKIVPGDRTELRHWPVQLGWGRHVKNALGIDLFDEHGNIECEPLLDAVDPRVWKAVFGPDTPVRPNVVPQWQGRRWRSFSARTVAAIAKGMHLATLYADPTTPVLPSEHPLIQPLLQIAGLDQRRARVYDESQMTRDLDEVVETDESQWLENVEGVIAREENWLRRIAYELHRCRRYYERPESQDDYRERPLPGATVEPVESRAPEFHERVGMAGDHPALLRKLGLVLDLRVTDPDRLRTAGWLSARVAVDGNLKHCRTTRVRCHTVGDDLLTVPGTTEWSGGALRLGDEELFTVLDMEADGSALKAERYLWTLPRLLEIEANADAVNAATPALRATGFTIARARQAISVQGRLDRQQEIQQVVGDGTPLDLMTEDVTRGYRVEVWDDTVRRWESLHRRLTDVRVARRGLVLDKHENEGFAQGTAAHETPGVEKSPVHVHDALFGWEGWSLSAERSGKRVRHDGGDEIVEDTPDTPRLGETLTHPVRIRNVVLPGTLPRLRLGRAYAFRAWAVDLAGNSRPHDLDPPPAVDPGVVKSALTVSLPSATEVDVTGGLPPGLRAATVSALETRRLAEAARTETSPDGIDALADPVVGPVVLDRLRSRRGAGAATAPQMRQRADISEPILAAVADPEQPFVADTALRGAADLAHLAAAQLAVPPVSQEASLAQAAVAALAVVTPLRPFLRWDPVPSPAVVPRHRYTEGESLRVLVVRSGVTQDLDTLAITVTDPATYAAEAHAAHPGLDLAYGEDSQRHLAPPKTSHAQAEQHGMFDSAIGSTDPVDHQKMLGWAMRENGSFAQVDRADLGNPPDRLPQPGIRLERQPGPPHAEPKSLPLAPGEAPAPGQYVVHDTDEVGLPYLPDPLAHGLSFLFAEAGRDRAIPFPFGNEGFTVRYGGSWPEIEPFRFVLAGGAGLAGRVHGRTITVALPPGDVQRFRLASSLRPESLDLFGSWRSLPKPVRDNADIVEAGQDGSLWALTPYEVVQLVHAVPRPIEAPRPTKLLAVRTPGATATMLIGAVDVHGPSTDSLTAEATWTDPADDLTLPRWEPRRGRAVAFSTMIRPYEDLAILHGGKDSETTLPGFGRIAAHNGVHEFGDTRHRLVDYRFRASTCFREYFHADLLAPPEPPDSDAPFDAPTDDGRSVVGPVVRVSVPSTAPPAAPVVHSVIPLFRWSEGAEPDQPMARRHERRAGVRIYLERPWYSSGDGELLGVLLATGGDDTFHPRPDDGSGFPFVSKWGGDPLWLSAAVTPRAVPLVQLDNLLHTSELDDRTPPARPVRPPARLPLATLPERPVVTVLGYQPQYNLDRGLWYVDAAIDPGTACWPFLRFAVCRYQPESIAGCHLSAPVRCDFVQVPPERSTSVSRTDDRHVRVVVSGPVGLRQRPERPPGGLAKAVDENRVVVARLQRRDPDIDTDLGWETVTVSRLVVRGRGTNDAEVAWVGELDAGTTIPLSRPGMSTPSGWRLTVEEWEMLPGDPPAPQDAGPVIAVLPVSERRLVYAAELAL